MIAYRIYQVDESGQIQGPPLVIECEDDAAVFIAAGKCIGDGAAEIWDGARKVGVIPSEE